MKTIAFVLTLLFMATPAIANEIEFPYKLEGPGKYELVVPAGAKWTVRDESNETLLRLEFADLKLNLEEVIKINEIEKAGIKQQHEMALEKQTTIFNLELDYRDEKIVRLEEQLKKARNKSFFGISTNYWSFVMGAAIMATAAGAAP